MRPGETNQDRAMFSVGNPSEKFIIRVKVYGRVKIYRSSESLPFEWKLTSPVKVWHLSELIIIWVKILPAEWKLAARVRDCPPGKNIPSEKITIGRKTCRLNKIVPSEWKYSHPSGNIVIRVEIKSSEWKIVFRVKKSNRTIRVKVSNIRVDELKSEWNWTCARKFIKMTLDEEVFNTEVVRIIKTVNFDFGVIIIRDNI